MERKTRDVYKLWWKGECIDFFDTKKEAIEMKKEYVMAYRDGSITIKRGRERI